MNDECRRVGIALDESREWDRTLESHVSVCSTCEETVEADRALREVLGAIDVPKLRSGLEVRVRHRVHASRRLSKGSRSLLAIYCLIALAGSSWLVLEIDPGQVGAVALVGLALSVSSLIPALLLVLAGRPDRVLHRLGFRQSMR